LAQDEKRKCTGGEARRRGRLGQRQMAMIEAGQDMLIFKRASASRPSGQWSDEDFDVLANGIVSAVSSRPTPRP
jgi:hypothetical protein